MWVGYLNLYAINNLERGLLYRKLKNNILFSYTKIVSIYVIHQKSIIMVVGKP